MQKLTDCKCPICGHLNKNLMLQTSKGYMECEKCLSIVKVTGINPNVPSEEKPLTGILIRKP